MEARNLMIGDWVYRPDCYDRVKEIRTNGIIGLDSLRGLIPFEGIKPIPLTPEILEKNGWIKTKYAYGRDCMEIHGVDELPKGVDNALSMARWSIDKNFQYHFLDLYMWKGSVMQHDVHYVHQLQHAFRIFGIEKEIIL